MTRSQQAIELKHQGCNCCQAVLMAHADCLRLSEAELMRLGSPFGLGMGNMEGPCGALCGAQMVAGLIADDARQQAKRIIGQFVEQAGSTTCKVLKGNGSGKPLCSCDECVRIAVEAVAPLVE